MSQRGQASQAAADTLELKPRGVPTEIARLRRELSTKEEQVRNLIRDTLDAQEAERERICLEVKLALLMVSIPDSYSSGQLLW